MVSTALGGDLGTDASMGELVGGAHSWRLPAHRLLRQTPAPTPNLHLRVRLGCHRRHCASAWKGSSNIITGARRRPSLPALRLLWPTPTPTPNIHPRAKVGRKGEGKSQSNTQQLLPGRAGWTGEQMVASMAGVKVECPNVNDKGKLLISGLATLHRENWYPRR